ncbi:MAG: T9SS type A sorting domain-containing protein, partial [Bacteroidota bacterium]
ENGYGAQPVSIELETGGPNQMTVYFDASATTPVGTFTSCDVGNPPYNYDMPDGVPDNFSVDCIRGQWSVEGTNLASTYSLSMYPSQELLSECNGVKDFIGMEGQLIEPCPTDDFRVLNVQDYGMFDLPSVSSVFLLSVEMNDFIAHADQEKQVIHLDWSTATEQDNRGFELLRSEDGQAFKPIGWVDGQGTTTDLSTYSFEDVDVVPNRLYYYQLRMVSFDGKAQFSDVIAGLIELEEMTRLSLFPNPVNMNNPRVFVPAFEDGNLKIQLFNMVGDLLFAGDFEVVEGLNRLHFLPVDIPSGVYQVIMQDELYTRRSELVILR